MTRRLVLVTTLAAATLMLSAYALRQDPKPAIGAPLDDHTAHMQAADMTAPTPAFSSAIGMEAQDQSIPASNNGAAARLAATPRHGEWVTFKAGNDEVMAWIVYPKSGAKAPVVVVVHEIFGLSSWVRGVADQVAADGFIAIAPDFLSRVRGGPSSMELSGDTARRMISGVDAAEKNRIIAAAANYAMMQPAATQKYGVIGYCWGGTAVWGHSVNGGVSGFSGGVAFYGAPYMAGGSPATATAPAVPATPSIDSLAKITVPVMLLNGTKDARIGAAMPAVESFMKSNNKDYVGINYDGAVHGFLRAQNDPKQNRDQTEEAANMAATRDGWPRTIAFLKKNLGAN